MCALVNTSPGWITSKLRITKSDSHGAIAAEFDIWDPNLAKYTQTVQYTTVVTTDKGKADDSDTSKAW